MKLLFLYVLILLLPTQGFADDMFIHDIPDFTQTDIAAKKAGGGWQYCAPVAVSNSLSWMSGNVGGQRGLIEKLASPGYMSTSLKNGTSPSGVIRGVDRIATELFGGYRILEYQGWRPHPVGFSKGVAIPEIKRILHGASHVSATWLNVGWYQKISGGDFLRKGGHWVTVVGSNNTQLILHDPAPRAGTIFSNEFVNYSVLDSGRLIGKKRGMPVSVKGYISLEEGFHIKSGADLAIIDGVIFFER